MTVRDIKENNPTEQELRSWHEKSGLPLKRFFNTSGQKYRELELKEKLPKMSEDEQYSLLATDGMLVKRPLLVSDDFCIGRLQGKRLAGDIWEVHLMSDNVINATENLSKRLDGKILFKEIVNETIDKLKKQETTLSPEDLGLDNMWEEICYQQQVEESFYWDMYIENLELMVDVAIDDCAKKYHSSVCDVIESIYGEYDEEETDYGEIETDVKEDVRNKILSLAADDECVSKQVDREYGDAATEDMYLSSIAMGMSEEEARERYYGNAEEDDVEEDD